jgi:Tfp pilus assembly protein PilF
MALITYMRKELKVRKKHLINCWQQIPIILMRCIGWDRPYIEMEDLKSARDLYSKTLQANGNAPLILAGMGHVNLIDGKKDEARQMFETAINLSTGKKGVDVGILNAIGRANVDAKDGDVAYALDKLKAAAQKDPKNADIFLNLGDAYRKAHEGGDAVINYDMAASANPGDGKAYLQKGDGLLHSEKLGARYRSFKESNYG